MISSVNTPVRNRHIESLRELSKHGAVSLECLILTHDDAALVHRLETAFANSATALLRLPQHLWQLDGNELPDAIMWAVESVGLKRVVLVGDSSAPLPDADVTLLPTSEVPADSHRQLLNRTQQAAAARQKSRQHFREQFVSLKQGLNEKSSDVAATLVIDGLFYRAESGAFTVYDEAADDFAMLG